MFYNFEIMRISYKRNEYPMNKLPNKKAYSNFVANKCNIAQ